jgi:hypothetical protein
MFTTNVGWRDSISHRVRWTNIVNNFMTFHLRYIVPFLCSSHSRAINFRRKKVFTLQRLSYQCRQTLGWSIKQWTALQNAFYYAMTSQFMQDDRFLKNTLDSRQLQLIDTSCSWTVRNNASPAFWSPVMFAVLVLSWTWYMASSSLSG